MSYFRAKMAAVTFAALLFVPGSPLLAVDGHHHGDEHHDIPSALSFDHGKKWQTDAPLRQGMAEIHKVMKANIHAVHQGHIPQQAYIPLSEKIDQQVSDIVRNCKLPPAADANLHVIIGQLAEGTQKMKESNEPWVGAQKVIGALKLYGEYFDDPEF